MPIRGQHDWVTVRRLSHPLVRHVDDPGVVTPTVARRGLVALACVALALGLLITATGCSRGVPSVVLSTERGAPLVGIVASPAGDRAVGWSGTAQLVVVTQGSSGCPNLPTDVVADGAHHVRITTAMWSPPGTNACTSDSAPTSATVAVPAGIDPRTPLTVTVDGADLTLPPAP